MKKRTRVRARSRAGSHRLTKRFREAMEEDEPVKTDLKYWAIHALHWHALLLAIVAFLAVGYSMHGYPQ